MELETKEGEFYLDSMANLPEYRGLNIGKKLIDFAILKARNFGIPYSILLVDINKPRLGSYYPNIGFDQCRKMILFEHEYNSQYFKFDIKLWSDIYF